MFEKKLEKLIQEAQPREKQQRWRNAEERIKKSIREHAKDSSRTFDIKEFDSAVLERISVGGQRRVLRHQQVLP